MTRRWQSTIQGRLTLLFAGMFFLAGALLIGVIYLQVAQSLSQPAGVPSRDSSRTQIEEARADALRGVLILSVACLGVIGAAATGFAGLLTCRTLRPLNQITMTVGRAGERGLHERVALCGRDNEVKELADSFDAMLERLDRFYDNQRRYVASASHELRTPLTINRTLIEVALDAPDAPASLRQLGATLLEVNQRHERLIDGVLVLATTEQRLSDHRPADLAEIARHVLVAAENAARSARVELRADLTDAPVSGDPLLLERLTHNLVDNAIRYNIENGWVRVATATHLGLAQLTVENSGPIVPGYEIDRLFEPFQRLAPQNGDVVTATPGGAAGRGAGLGLSIVRSVTYAHDGQIHADARPDGGLTIQVRLPIRGTR